MIPQSKIHLAAILLGRLSPPDKYIPLAVELALLAPYFAQEPPKNLDPSFYHTMSYEGDMAKYARLREIVQIADSYIER